MSVSPSIPRPLPISPAGVVSLVLVVAGLILGATVSMGFMALFGLGAFGPALLREAGILRDQDEFQRQASLRAGLRAYLAVGVFLCAVIVLKKWGQANLDHDEYSSSSVLAMLAVTYFLSHVSSFWDAQKAAFRILIGFGMFWLVFVVLSHGLTEPMEALVTVPFFAVAFASKRWPRVSGAVVTLAALGAIPLFRLQRVFASDDHSSLFVLVVFVLPLLWCGVRLLMQRAEAEESTTGPPGSPAPSD